MTHPAYLLARLNPKNVRFDVGAGGAPELTSSDIAAALAMIPGALGRDLVCLAWWPDSRATTEPRVLELLRKTVLEQWSRRESAMLDALLSIASIRDRDSNRRAQYLYSKAHEERWPSIVEMEDNIRSPQGVYGRLAPAVLIEVTVPRRCPRCEGRGFVFVRTGMNSCTRCDESGLVARSNTDRAEALGVSESNYRKTWDRPYTWLLDHCGEALRLASDALRASVA